MKTLIAGEPLGHGKVPNPWFLWKGERTLNSGMLVSGGDRAAIAALWEALGGSLHVRVRVKGELGTAIMVVSPSRGGGAVRFKMVEDI